MTTLTPIDFPKMLQRVTSAPEKASTDHPCAHVLAQLPELGDKCLPAFRSVCERWVWTDPGLVLLGPSGSGKTTAAVALVKRLVAEGHPLARSIRFAQAHDIPIWARPQAPVNEREALDSAFRVRLLVLDDIGWEHDPDQILFRLVNARYAKRLTTISTSGLTLDEISKRYPAAVIRRLVEVGGKRGEVINGFEGGQ